MKFKTDEVINCVEDEQRWIIKDKFFLSSRHNVWKVRDQAENMNERELLMMTLNYDGISERTRSACIRELRASFDSMVKVICNNYNFIPETIDLVKYCNSQDLMEPDLGSTEPALIFSQPYGISPDKYLSRVQSEKDFNNLRINIFEWLKNLEILHHNNVVVRQLKMGSVRSTRVEHKSFFTGIETFIRMDQFDGYNQNAFTLTPDRVFSAPECFNASGYLSPATDFYALGKLVLQILLTEQKYLDNFKNDHFPKNEKIQSLVEGLGLPDPWPRFLSVCLQHDQERRFKNTKEIKDFLNNTSNKKSNPNKSANPVSEQDSKPWKYSMNPSLPEAALIIWDDELTKKNEKFDFSKLYSMFLYRYTYSPRLYFQRVYGESRLDNPYYKILSDKFALNIIFIRDKSSAISILHGELDNHLSNIRNIIIVGHSDVAAVQSLFNHPDAPKWNIHWIKKGGWSPSNISPDIIDASLFIHAK